MKDFINEHPFIFLLIIVVVAKTIVALTTGHDLVGLP